MRFPIQIKIWYLYDAFEIISFKNVHVIDSVLTGTHAKVRFVVIFLQFLMRSTAQTVRKGSCVLFRGLFIKQNNYQSMLNIYV